MAPSSESLFVPPPSSFFLGAAAAGGGGGTYGGGCRFCGIGVSGDHSRQGSRDHPAAADRAESRAGPARGAPDRQPGAASAAAAGRPELRPRRIWRGRSTATSGGKARQLLVFGSESLRALLMRQVLSDPHSGSGGGGNKQKGAGKKNKNNWDPYLSYLSFLSQRARD